MVLPSDRDPANGPLDQIQIHRQIAVVHIARERYPIRQARLCQKWIVAPATKWAPTLLNKAVDL